MVSQQVEGVVMATAEKTMALEQEKISEQTITRFDGHQVVQHAGLMTSFTFLVITGLPMKFNTWAISQGWAALWGGIGNLRAVHHFSAYVMVAICLYHAVYLAYNLLVMKRPFPVEMIPAYDDFVKLYQELGYFLGIWKEKPQYDRFNWREKFDYWAIFWGMPIMVISGFVLMYPVLVTRFLPGWVVPAALIAHGDEAMLALC